ncbi:hypothetical protein D3C86_1790820 [compost metagenome]
MSRIGSTISLAGSPRIKAIIMKPSSPSKFAKGSKKAAIWFSTLSPPTITLPSIQVRIPAGAATTIARVSTFRDFSLEVIRMVFQICGRR